MPETELQRLLDREAIRGIMVRYTWALFRADPDLLLSLYWPGAHEDHGEYVGPIEGFADWVMPRLRTRLSTMIMLNSVDIDFVENDKARVESLGQVNIRVRKSESEVADLILGTRYEDEIERRGGEWRIASRRASQVFKRDLGVTNG